VASALHFDGRRCDRHMTYSSLLHPLHFPFASPFLATMVVDQRSSSSRLNTLSCRHRTVSRRSDEGIRCDGLHSFLRGGQRARAG
jgi:hypothetical protein